MEENKSAKTDFGRKVKEHITNNKNKVIQITFPVTVFEKLDDFSKVHTNHCYWLAIEKAIDFYMEEKTGDLKYIMLYNEIQRLGYEIDKLKKDNEIADDDVVDIKKLRKTFGRKESE